MRRREIVVQSLVAMGVTDAEQRVVVAPAYVPGITSNEAESAYLRNGNPGLQQCRNRRGRRIRRLHPPQWTVARAFSADRCRGPRSGRSAFLDYRSRAQVMNMRLGEFIGRFRPAAAAAVGGGRPGADRLRSDRRARAGRVAIRVVVAGAQPRGQDRRRDRRRSASRKGKAPHRRRPLASPVDQRSGQTAQAEHLYQVVIQRQPENPIPYHRLGIMRAKEGKFEQSNELTARALQLAPSDAKLVSDIGYCYYLQNRLDEAEQLLRRALEMEPNDPAIANNLAPVLGEQRRDEECMAMLRRAGNEQQAYANMAFIYAQRGDTERAEATYSRALTLDASLRPAALALAQLGQRKRLRSQTPPKGQALQVDYQQAQASPPPRAIEPAGPGRPSYTMAAPPSMREHLGKPSLPRSPATPFEPPSTCRRSIGSRVRNPMKSLNYAPVASYGQAPTRLPCPASRSPRRPRPSNPGGRRRCRRPRRNSVPSCRRDSSKASPRSSCAGVSGSAASGSGRRPRRCRLPRRRESPYRDYGNVACVGAAKGEIRGTADGSPFSGPAGPLCSVSVAGVRIPPGWFSRVTKPLSSMAAGVSSRR